MDLKTLKLLYWDRRNVFDILGLDLKSTWTTLALDSFYDKLYLEWKETRAILLAFGFGLVNVINQA